MRTHRRIPLLFLLAAVAGCESSPTAQEPLRELPRQLTPAERSVISAGNAFAFGLLREVGRGKEGENVFVSPLSASMTLGMTANGARGATQDEMRAVLGFSQLQLPAMNEAYRSLIALLTELDRGVDMRIANSIWYRQGFTVEQPFVDATRQYFGAQVTALDFTSPRAPQTINAWVDEHTGGRIREIVTSIEPQDVMYLINAVYFKAPWREPFERRDTRDAPFHNLDGTTSTVRMMHRAEGSASLRRDGALRVVEIPYARGAFAMTILLPDPGADVHEVIASLTPERWDALVADLPAARVALALPRFRLEYARRLNEPLEALGMRAAFEPGRADFGGLSAAGAGLYVSEVMQKTFVEVNEEGTEAAAATSVAIADSAPPEVRMDRPFVFAIRERFSGSILFIGKLVRSPAAAG